MLRLKARSNKHIEKKHVDVSVMQCDLHPDGASLHYVYLLLDMLRLNYDLLWDIILYGIRYTVQVIFI